MKSFSLLFFAEIGKREKEENRQGQFHKNEKSFDSLVFSLPPFPSYGDKLEILCPGQCPHSERAGEAEAKKNGIEKNMR